MAQNCHHPSDRHPKGGDRALIIARFTAEPKPGTSVFSSPTQTGPSEGAGRPSRKEPEYERDPPASVLWKCAAGG